MSKKPDISDEEIDLFRRAMKTVKPIPSANRVVTRKRKELATKTSADVPKNPAVGLSYDLYLDKLNHSLWVGSEEVLSYFRSGLHPKTIRQLKRGNLIVNAKLDLHRLSADEALYHMEKFIGRCHEKRFRWVLIIHGKGGILHKLPKLKNLANEYLKDHPQVLAFHSAQAKDGGTGAIYVLLSTK